MSEDEPVDEPPDLPADADSPEPEPPLESPAAGVPVLVDPVEADPPTEPLVAERESVL